MTTQTSKGPWPGRFVWHDLMTTDAAASQRFYCALFDWQIHEVPMPGFTYRMIVAGPGPIGGIVEEKNIPASHWMPYLAVTDVDAMAARIQKANGTVCVPPTDIPGTGRFAVVGDPLGAYFSIFKGLPESAGYDPDEPIAGRVCWNELLSTDDAAAQRFYSSLFGWKEQAKDMGPMGTYRVQTLGEKQAGGIMKNPQNGAPSAWLAYFLAPDLARATAKAKQLGAKPCIENMPIPGTGAFSMLIDPVGAVFALFAPSMAPGGTPPAATTNAGATASGRTATNANAKPGRAPNRAGASRAPATSANANAQPAPRPPRPATPAKTATPARGASPAKITRLAKAAPAGRPATTANATKARTTARAAKAPKTGKTASTARSPAKPTRPAKQARAASPATRAKHGRAANTGRATKTTGSAKPPKPTRASSPVRSAKPARAAKR